MVIGRDVPTKSFSVLSYSSSIFSDVNIYILISPLYSQESEFLLKSKSFLMFFFSLMLCRVMILNLNFSLVLTTLMSIKEIFTNGLFLRLQFLWIGMVCFDNCNASCHFWVIYAMGYDILWAEHVWKSPICTSGEPRKRDFASLLSITRLRVPIPIQLLLCLCSNKYMYHGGSNILHVFFKTSAILKSLLINPGL